MLDKRFLSRFDSKNWSSIRETYAKVKAEGGSPQFSYTADGRPIIFETNEEALITTIYQGNLKIRRSCYYPEEHCVEETYI